MKTKNIWEVILKVIVAAITAALTATGLELKAVIEQLREQVQNVE